MGQNLLNLCWNWKNLVFIWILTRYITYSSQSLSINWLATGFLLCYPSSTITKAVTVLTTESCQKAILLKIPMTASYFFLAALLVRCSWFEILTEQGSLHIHFLSLLYESLFWEELKVHWITQETTNGLLLTWVLQAGTIASFKGGFEVKARMSLK